MSRDEARPGPDDRFELPGYEILAKAGEGGMATVWKASQLSLNRLVAIKVLSPELGRDPEAVRHFQEEARAAAKLGHPGLVRVHDAGIHEGQAYFTMDYLSGPTVGRLLDEQPRLPENDALAIAESVARALQYAWKYARIIHCDVKPDNIMLDGDGSLKLTDLGLARTVGRRTNDERHQYVTGTPNYTSPEQADGLPDLDCRTDIYALGATLYHVLTGTLPFGREDPSRVLRRQLEDTLPDPMDIEPSVSSGMAWLIEKMMVKDRALRCANWDSVLGDLLTLRDCGALFSPVPGPGQSTVRRSERRKPAALRTRNATTRRKVHFNPQEASRARTHPRRRFPLLRTLVWLVLLAGLALGSWKIIRFTLDQPQSPAPPADLTDILPPRSRLQPQSGEPAAEPEKHHRGNRFP